MTRKICIYHAHCADGMTSAWVVMRYANEWANPTDYIPCSYGNEPPCVDDADVLMVDFSFKRQMLEAMAEKANSITILDHHKTAAADLAEPIPGVEVVFDMERSGAQLAWDHFCTGARPAIVDYTADRDLWRWKLHGSREVSAVIASHEQTFDVWDDLAARMQADEDLGQMIQEGAAILRKIDKDVAAIIGASQRTMVIGGLEVPVANCPPFLASETAGRMAETAPFAATYYDGPKGRAFSLRSRGDQGADVSVIAAKYGGGGHRNAAGLLMPKGWEGEATQ